MALPLVEVAVASVLTVSIDPDGSTVVTAELEVVVAKVGVLTKDLRSCTITLRKLYRALYHTPGISAGVGKDCTKAEATSIHIQVVSTVCAVGVVRKLRFI